MPIDAVGTAGSATAASAAATSGTGDGNLSVSQLDFLRLLVTQLSFQDPLKPMDNQEFLAQIAQFSALQETRQLGDKIDSLLGIQAAAQSVGLIGRTVEISTSSGAAQGTVTTVTFSGGQPLLSLQLADGSFLTNVNPSTVTLVR
jgi:flagellar basal-body rod modification protein FlgD